MTQRYRTYAPGAYGELERLAGILDREAFWRGKTESQARTEIHERIRERIASHQFSPCWSIPANEDLRIRTPKKGKVA